MTYGGNNFNDFPESTYQLVHDQGFGGLRPPSTTPMEAMQLRSESCSAFNKVGKCHFARGRDGQAESLYVKLCEISSKVCHQKVFKSVDFWLELFKKSKIWTFLRHHIGERNLVIGFRLYEIPNLARLLHLVLRLCTAQCKWGSSSCGSICDSWCSSLI